MEIEIEQSKWKGHGRTPTKIKSPPPSPSISPIGVGTFKISEKAVQYVNDVLRSERLSYGPYIQKFESVFAAAHDCKFAIMTNSGTSSLMIALYALKLKYGWQDGDEVIVPSVTFVATVNVVIQLNLKPVIVDVDPIYYELDPNQLEKAITPKTRCIIPVHLFGSPCDMERILEIAANHHLHVLEDSCETMFTRLNGKSVGAFGEIGCFSTYVAHLLCTGVGGLCTTNNPELAIALRSLANHGRDSIYLNIDDDKDKTLEEMRLIIQKRFSFVTLGYSFRVTEMEGALGLAEFENHEENMRLRRQNAEFFLTHLKPLGTFFQLPALRPGAGHAFMMFPIVLRDTSKETTVQFLESRGIETRDMLPLVNQPVYQKLLGIRESDFPVANWINRNGFYIGCHQGISEIEREHVVDSFFKCFNASKVTEEKACLLILSKVEHKVDALVLQNIIDSLQLDIFDDKILLDANPGSQISTAFEKAGFQIISDHSGKGALLKRGLLSTKCKYILVIGVDGADNPHDLNNILLKLRQGYDIVVGSRFLPGGGRNTERRFSYRSLGNRFFTFLLGTIFRQNVTDGNNLLRGFSRPAITGLGIETDGDSVMFEMSARALKNGLKYTECPTLESRSLLLTHKRNRFISALHFAFLIFKITFQKRELT